MSTRYEWFHAASTAVEYIPPGHDVDSGDQSPPWDADGEYSTGDLSAIVLSGDEATVLHGTVSELRDLAQRILAALSPTEVGTASYILHYVSQDYPVTGTWSVYREAWDFPDAPEPIDGTQTWVSTHATEAEAYAEADRLQGTA